LRVVCQEISHKIRLFFASNFLLFFVNKFYLKNTLFFASIIYKIMNARDSEFFHQISTAKNGTIFRKRMIFLHKKQFFVLFSLRLGRFCVLSQKMLT